MPLNTTREFVQQVQRDAQHAGLITTSYGTVLPQATAELRFQQFVVLAVPGTSADILYMCLADGASTTGYSWVEIDAGNHGASGTGTVDSGSTTDVIAHGLPYTPTIDQIIITFAEQATNDYGRWWVDTIGDTNFTVNVSADPGASNLDFGWRVIT